MKECYFSRPKRNEGSYLQTSKGRKFQSQARNSKGKVLEERVSFICSNNREKTSVSGIVSKEEMGAEELQVFNRGQTG